MSSKRKSAPSVEERFDEDDEGSGNEGGNANSSSARKAQNRIAQREFRLRKQQYVRDLEAKVEMLSGDREERWELLMVLMRNLLKENADLRNMVRSMAGFLGEGMGSCLPRLGLSSDGLDAILSRAETDTAYEAYLALKNARDAQVENPPPGLPQPIGEGKRKRKNAVEPVASAPAKTGRSTGGTWSPPSSREPLKRSRLDASPTRPSQYHNLFSNADASTSRTISDATRAQVSALPPPPQLGTYSDYSLGLQMGQPPQASSVCGDGGSYHQQIYGDGSVRTSADFPHPPPPPGPLRQPPSQPQPMQYQESQLRQQPQQEFHHPVLGEQQQPQTVLPPITSFGSSQGQSSQSRPAQEAQRNLTSRSGSPDMSYQLTPVVNTPPRPEEQQRQRVREALLAVNVSGPGGFTSQMRDNLVDALGDGEEHERKKEALELISYHLNNFKNNPNYNLPTSLMPTIMQRSIPHEHAIDGIIFPIIRERMITYRGKYDLLEAMNGLILGSRIHGDDTLDHHNWEFSEQWLSTFSVLTTQEVYDVTNKWRAQRGDPPLFRPERSKVGPEAIERAYNRLSGPQHDQNK